MNFSQNLTVRMLQMQWPGFSNELRNGNLSPVGHLLDHLHRSENNNGSMGHLIDSSDHLVSDDCLVERLEDEFVEVNQTIWRSVDCDILLNGRCKSSSFNFYFFLSALLVGVSLLSSPCTRNKAFQQFFVALTDYFVDLLLRIIIVRIRIFALMKRVNKHNRKFFLHFSITSQ